MSGERTDCNCSGFGWATPSFHAPSCPYRLAAGGGPDSCVLEAQGCPTSGSCRIAGECLIAAERKTAAAHERGLENSYGEPPVHRGEGFNSCGSCVNLVACGGAGYCMRALAEDELAAARPSVAEVREDILAEEREAARRRAWPTMDADVAAARERALDALGVQKIRRRIEIPYPADRFAEHDRAGRSHFTRPRRDPRVRTAPHGDALDTRVRTPYPNFFRSAFPLIEATRYFEACDDKQHILVRIGDWNAAPARLTPGMLKLAGARIMATHSGTEVADEMARQIDFEWEERRWRVPDGDAAAAENGMGC